MNPLARLRLGTRLALGFALLLLLMAAAIALALTRAARVGDEARQIVAHDWPAAEAIGTVNALTRANARRTMELFFAADAAETARVREHMAANRRRIDTALQQLQTLARAGEEQALLQRIRTHREAYVASFEKVARLLAEGRRDAATQALKTETLPAIDTLQAEIVAMNDLQRRRVESGGAEIAATTASTRVLLAGFGAAALLAGIAAALLLTRSITGPIGAAVQVARAVAAGDLGSRIEVHGRDETAELMAALQTMNTNLARIVGQVRDGSESIATGSTQIATGNLDLSQRTEEQASNLQQTAASMEQLNASVRNNADHARQATQLAAAATAAAGRGGELVGRVVATMGEISAGSRRIRDIIAVIDGVAFQTNILALNASVEAARAGEQGRGFAVVAGEVRHLAHRCAEAAREIKALIGASVDRVEAGATLVGEAGGAMGDIVLQVRRVSDLMAQISAAAVEQASGIGQVNDAVTQLDQVTQQNAALVEESAAAAGSLQQQAARLVAAVGAFRLDAATA